MPARVSSLGRGYKPWLIASIAVLVGSLFLLACAVVASFVNFGEAAAPLWVTLLIGFAIFGVCLGFGGFVLLFSIAGWRSLREERRIRLAPPEKSAD